MKKLIALLFSFILFQTICSKNIIQISMPKAGTHLLRKCIGLLTGIPLSQTHTSKPYPSGFYLVDPGVFARGTMTRDLE